MPEAGFELIARRATGSLRDAVNLLEQVVAASGTRPTLSEVEDSFGGGSDAHAAAIVLRALAGDLPGAFNSIASAREDGAEPRQLQRAAQERLRSLLLVKSGAEAALELGDEALEELRADSSGSDVATIVRLLSLVSAADFRADPLSPLPLELAIARALVEPREPAAQRPAPAAVPRPAARPSASTSVPEQNSEPRPFRTAPAPAGAAPLPREIVPFPGTTVARAEVTPEARPAPPPIGPGEELTLQRLQELMGFVYDRLKEQRSRAGALINSPCNVVAVADGSVTLAFKHDFLAARIKSEEGGRHLVDIQDALESISGQRYRLEIQVDPDVQRWVRVWRQVRRAICSTKLNASDFGARGSNGSLAAEIDGGWRL